MVYGSGSLFDGWWWLWQAAAERCVATRRQEWSIFPTLRGEQLGAQVHLPSPFSRQHRQTEEGQQQRGRFRNSLGNDVRCRCAHAKLIERGSTLSD